MNSNLVYISLILSIVSLIIGLLAIILLIIYYNSSKQEIKRQAQISSLNYNKIVKVKYEQFLTLNFVKGQIYYIQGSYKENDFITISIASNSDTKIGDIMTIYNDAFGSENNQFININADGTSVATPQTVGINSLAKLQKSESVTLTLGPSLNGDNLPILIPQTKYQI